MVKKTILGNNGIRTVDMDIGDPIAPEPKKEPSFFSQPRDPPTSTPDHNEKANGNIKVSKKTLIIIGAVFLVIVIAIISNFVWFNISVSGNKLKGNETINVAPADVTAPIYLNNSNYNMPNITVPVTVQINMSDNIATQINQYVNQSLNHYFCKLNNTNATC